MDDAPDALLSATGPPAPAPPTPSPLLSHAPLAVSRPLPSRFATLGATLSAILALGQFRLILLLLDTDYTRSMEAAQGVVAGTPHWRVFQSRVLAPYAIQGMERLLGSYGAAYKAFCAGALVAAGYLAWTLGRRVGGTLRSAGLGLLLFHVAFAFLLSRPWLYAWDYVGAILFLLFVHSFFPAVIE